MLKRKIRSMQESGDSRALTQSEKIVSVTLQVETPNVDHGGTDANVYFVINTQKFLMDKPNYNDFERGDNDSYTFPVAMTMSEFRKATIEIGHDNRSRNAGWYCGKVNLYVRKENTYWNRLYKRWPQIGWLATDENQGELWAVLQTGEEL